MTDSDGEQAQRGDLTLSGLGESDGASKSRTISCKKAIADGSEGGESASSARSTPSHLELVDPDQGAHRQGAGLLFATGALGAESSPRVAARNSDLA